MTDVVTDPDVLDPVDPVDPLEIDPSVEAIDPVEPRDRRRASSRAATSAPPRRPGHLWQIDVVRLLTFAAVIAVHSIDFTQSESSKVAAGALMLLQFGREVFFTISGFVLVYAAIRRPQPAVSFWRRRVPAVALPYLAWSGIYYGYSIVAAPHIHPSWTGFGYDLVTGESEYHLYFLLVTLQLYLVFPLLMRFVRATASKAWTVLGLAGAANLAWLAVLHDARAPAGGLGRIVWVHAFELLPTYAVYVLAGCYAAANLKAVQRVVDRRSRPLVVISVVSAAVAIAGYVAQLGGRAPRDAGSVLQPVMVLTCVAATLLLYLAGSRWAAGSRRHERGVAVASDISFGVYLAHPLVLALLLDRGLAFGMHRMPAQIAVVLAFVGTALGSAALALVLRRTRVAPLLIGRPRVPAERHPAREWWVRTSAAWSVRTAEDGRIAGGDAREGRQSATN